MKKRMNIIFIVISIILIFISALGAEDKKENDDIFNEKKPKFVFKGQYKDLFTYQWVNNYYGDNFLTRENKNLVANLKRIRLSPEFLYRDILLIVC